MADRLLDVQFIREILPSLADDVLHQLVLKLEECGVAAYDDLQYVSESDISSVLRPVQARRLLAHWKKDGKSQGSETPNSTINWSKFSLPLENMTPSLKHAKVEKKKTRSR
jgi:hypothetical protein